MRVAAIVDSKAQFIKFRESWSHGYGEWQYTLIPSWCCFDKPDSIDTFLNETETPSDWSEHWRGWEWIKIEYPPMDFIDEKIDDIKDSIAYYKESLKFYKKLKEEVFIKNVKDNLKCGEKSSISLTEAIADNHKEIKEILRKTK